MSLPILFFSSILLHDENRSSISWNADPISVVTARFCRYTVCMSTGLLQNKRTPLNKPIWILYSEFCVVPQLPYHHRTQLYFKCLLIILNLNIFTRFEVCKTYTQTYFSVELVSEFSVAVSSWLVGGGAWLGGGGRGGRTYQRRWDWLYNVLIPPLMVNPSIFSSES